ACSLIARSPSRSSRSSVRRSPYAARCSVNRGQWTTGSLRWRVWTCFRSSSSWCSCRPAAPCGRPLNPPLPRPRRGPGPAPGAAAQAADLDPDRAQAVLEPEVLADVLGLAAGAVPGAVEVGEPRPDVLQPVRSVLAGQALLELPERPRHQLVRLLGRVQPQQV